MGGVLGLLCAALHHRFLAVAFDPETSRVLGMRVDLVELAFFSGLGALLGVAISQIGVLGALGSVVGTFASIRWDVPTGAAICLALAAPLPVALGVSRWKS